MARPRQVKTKQKAPDQPPPNESPPDVILAPGSSGERVQLLQQRLHQLGVDVGPTDGIYGRKLADAVARFQELTGAKGDGIFGPETEHFLNIFEQLQDAAQPLPEPTENDGRPALWDTLRAINALDDPLLRLQRLLDVQERALRYSDEQLEDEALGMAFRTAGQGLRTERGRELLESEPMGRLLSILKERGDSRFEKLRALFEKVRPEPEPTPTKPPRAKKSPPPLTLAKTTPKIASDMWDRNDQLGYASYARSLAALITHPDTKPPLTIGLKAPWGAGKTSLMRMVQALLDGAPEHTGMTGRDQADHHTQDAGSMAVDGGWQTRLHFRELLDSLKNPQQPGMLLQPFASETGSALKIPPRATVWFNAWKYQNSEQLWAGLAHCIVSQVTARLQPEQRERFWLSLHARRVDVNMVRRAFYRQVFEEFLPNALLWLAGTVGAVVLGVVLPQLFSLLGFAGAGLMLNRLWDAWQKKLEASRDNPVKGAFREFLRAPVYEGKQGFLHLVESDLREVLKLVATPEQPLVVFIDDLDRCAPPKVAQVVEAINLFLGGDYPNCVFVLGMEPEMVASALELSYQDLANKLKGIAAARDRAPLGWRFMEKIVQLPLTIPPPTSSGMDHYLQWLLGAVPESTETEPAPAEDLVQKFEKRIGKAEDLKDVETMTLQGLGGRLTSKEKVAFREAGKRVFSRKMTTSDPLVQQFVAEAMRWSVANPRQAKRYINLYRFYAALRYTYLVDGFYSDAKVPVPTDAVLAKFVTLAIHWPQAISWLWILQDGQTPCLAKLENKARQLQDNPPEHGNQDEAWVTFLEELQLAQDWTIDSDFRRFLAAGEPLSHYQGGRLW